MLEHVLEGNIQSGLKFFIFYFLFLDKFVLKTWISRRVSYFVGILSGVRNMWGPFSGRIGLPPAIMGWAASCDDGP